MRVPADVVSPYQHVNAPHLVDSMRSKRGEFRLVPLPDGRTRLEGSTWYEIEMFPQASWTQWSDLLVHHIHERVLEHIKHLSESRAPRTPEPLQHRTLPLKPGSCRQTTIFSPRSAASTGRAYGGACARSMARRTPAS